MFDQKKFFERDIKILEFTLEEIERINKAYEEFLDEFHFVGLCEYLESRGLKFYGKLENGKKVYGYSDKFLVIVSPLGNSQLLILEKTYDGKAIPSRKELPASLEKIKEIVEFCIEG